MGWVAAAHQLCFWTSYALLIAQWSHVSLFEFFGILPLPPPSAFKSSVFWAFIILGAPSSALLECFATAYFLPALVVCSIFNGVLWGAGLAWPIHQLSQRFRHVERI